MVLLDETYLKSDHFTGGGSERLEHDSPVPLVRRDRGRCCSVEPYGVLKEPDRLLAGDIAAQFLAAVLDQPRVKTDHFTVDRTLIEAWASLKSFKPRHDSDKPPAGGRRNVEADFHGKKRSNETHASTTDPGARLYRKGPGKEAKLCFIGHCLLENHDGLLVDTCLTPADGPISVKIR